MSPTGVAVVVIGLVALGAALATVFATAHGPSVNPDGVSYLRMADRLPPLVGALVVWGVVRITPLNARLFAPFLVLVLLSLPALSTMRGARVLSVGVVVSIIFNASATSGRLDPFDNGILGIANAPTVVATRELDGAIASNAAGALWLLTGKEVRWIPKVTDPYTDEPTHDFQAAIGRLRDGLRGGGHLVWLAAYDYRNYLPTEEQVVQALGAVLVERFADGAIYALGP